MQATDHGQQLRDGVEPFDVQPRVVPHAQLVSDRRQLPRVAAGANDIALHAGLGIARDDARCVARRKVAGIGLAGIDQGLHVCRLLPLQGLVETGWDFEDHLCLAAIEQAQRLGGRIDLARKLEVWLLEAVDQIARCDAAVRIVHAHRRIAQFVTGAAGGDENVGGEDVDGVDEQGAVAQQLPDLLHRQHHDLLQPDAREPQGVGSGPAHVRVRLRNSR